MEVFKAEDFGGEIYIVPKDITEGVNICRSINLDEKKSIFISPSYNGDWRLEMCEGCDLFYPDALRAAALFLRRIRALPASDYEIITPKGRSVLGFAEKNPTHDIGGSVGKCRILQSVRQALCSDIELEITEVMTPLGIYGVTFCESCRDFDMNTLGPIVCNGSCGFVPRGAVAAEVRDNEIEIKTYIFAQGGIRDTCAFAAAAQAAYALGMTEEKDVKLRMGKACCLCSVGAFGEVLLYSLNPSFSRIYAN